MKLLFLGTSAGAPTKKRNVSALAIQEDSGKDWYLVDCGEGTQHQLLHTSLSLAHLKGIFITHVHGDHCYGLLGLLASAGMNGRKAPLTIVGPAALEQWLRVSHQLTACYMPYEWQFKAVEEQHTWQLGNMHIERTALSHRVPSYAYSFTEPRGKPVLNTQRLLADGIARGPLWGQIQRGENINVAGKAINARDYLLPAEAPLKVVVAGDNDQPQLLTEACKDAQLLVHEATFTQAVAERVGPGVGHSSAAAIASFAEQMALPNLILTHISPRYAEQPQNPDAPGIANIAEEARSAYSGQLSIAADFKQYHLHKGATHYHLHESD